jgi:hypothetical protein
MSAKRIPALTAIAGASTANDDNLVIFDTSENTTKRILRSQLAAGIVGDLPYTPSGGIAATTVPTAIAELDTEKTTLANVLARLDDNDGSSLVGYTQGGTGASNTTVQAKLREIVSVKDFGAVGDGVADDTAAIQLALNSGAKEVVGVASHTYRVSSTFTYVSGGVTENVALNLLQGVTFNGNGCKFVYTGSGSDTVLNQFWFFANDTVQTTFDGYQVCNTVFENDGTAGSYVSGVAVYGGDNTKASGWLKRVNIFNIHNINIRVGVKCYMDRPDTVLPIDNVNIYNITAQQTSSAVIALDGVSNVVIDNINAIESDFDIVMLFAGKNVVISNIVGNNITENIVGLESLFDAREIQNVSISNVSSDSGKLSISTGAGTTGFIRDVTYSSVNAPTFNIDNSVGGGTVSRVKASLNLKPSAISRGVFINNASDIDLNIDMFGSVTVAGCSLVNTDRIKINGKINITGSAFPGLSLDRARLTTGKVAVYGGSEAMYLIGVTGTMGGVDLELDCSGQTVAAIAGDGTTSTSHKVNIKGNYGAQAITYVTVQNSSIALEQGQGATKTIASGSILVSSEIHSVTSETGVTDNLDSLTGNQFGRSVQLFATSGHTITVTHAAGNIRTKTGGSVTMTNTVPINLMFNGVNWCEV